MEVFLRKINFLRDVYTVKTITAMKRETAAEIFLYGVQFDSGKKKKKKNVIYYRSSETIMKGKIKKSLIPIKIHFTFMYVYVSYLLAIF